MRAHIEKLPQYTNEDVKDACRIVQQRIPMKDITIKYVRRNSAYTHLLCRCNICNRLLGKYTVDDFGVPIKAVFELEEHPCRKRGGGGNY